MNRYPAQAPSRSLPSPVSVKVGPPRLELSPPLCQAPPQPVTRCALRRIGATMLRASQEPTLLSDEHQVSEPPTLHEATPSPSPTPDPNDAPTVVVSMEEIEPDVEQSIEKEWEREWQTDARKSIAGIGSSSIARTLGARPKVHGQSRASPRPSSRSALPEAEGTTPRWKGLASERSDLRPTESDRLAGGTRPRRSPRAHCQFIEEVCLEKRGRSLTDRILLLLDGDGECTGPVGTVSRWLRRTGRLLLDALSIYWLGLRKIVGDFLER